MNFNGLIPELQVSNIERSKKFYTEILGFTLCYERKKDKFAFLEINNAQIMIQQGGAKWHADPLVYPFGNGVNFQIEVNNVEKLYENAKGKANIFKQLFNDTYMCGKNSYTEKQFIVLDPDGYMLRFSQTINETK